MRRHKVASVLALLAAMALSSVPARAQADFYLKNGDRVVFYGDSITDQRLYTTFVETYVVTRFPKLQVSFVHSGWGGDRVTGGGGGPIDVRLQRDVIAYRPSVMTIMLGMNDAGYRPYDEGLFKTYSDGYRHIIETMKAASSGVRITVIQPSPFDDVTRPPTVEGGYNNVLIRYAEFVKQLAEREGLTVADLNSPLVAALEKARSADAELAKKIVPDRVHPDASGHLLMAEALLKSWHAPAIVAAVEIDGAAGRAIRSDNASVTGVQVRPAISWEETDRALPMPVNLKDPVTALAVHSSDFIEALDQETLKVTGLTAPRYTLKIDGEDAGVFTKDELAAGVNLASLPTPMAKQAAAVHDLTLKHNNVHFSRWRQVQVPLGDLGLANYQAALDSLDRLEDELVEKQRAAAQPKAHRFELLAKQD